MSAVTDLIDEIKSQSQASLRVVGPTKVRGEVAVQSSKNSTMKLIVAAVAVPGEYVFKQFPYILDPLELLNVVEFLGGEVTLNDDRSVRIDTRNIQDTDIPYTLTKTTTSAFGFAGALLGRFGAVSIGKPGGDELGPRPVDLHIDGFRALGANVEDGEEAIVAQWNDTQPEKRFAMRMPATGVTVNFVSAVVAAQTKAYLENPALDSDMQAMYSLLRQTGVVIELEDGVLVIDATGVQTHETVIEFVCWPDRNDAFTWLAYGALSQQGLMIHNIQRDTIETALPVLESLGIQIEEVSGTELFVKAPAQDSKIDREMIVAGLGQQFHSDWAPLLEVVLTQIHGNTRIVQTLFSHRVRQSELLIEMGADITVSGGQPPEGTELYFRDDPETSHYIIDVRGPVSLNAISAKVGNDVRACAALVVAASQAKGESTLSDVSALYRGYENYIERLRSIGVDISMSK